MKPTKAFVAIVVFRDPQKPGTKYTTISYDQWRTVDGRADEHWDTAMLAPVK